jgi:hypothetical protein
VKCLQYGKGHATRCRNNTVGKTNKESDIETTVGVGVNSIEEGLETGQECNIKSMDI